MAVAAASAAAGAVGGYFIGRKIDKSRAETVWRMDETERSLLRAQLCLPPPHVMFMAAN
jgi:membrane protein YqaA with SNARE-associated domain